MLQTLKNHLINIPGWRTNRKIVVFESDDWGSIRMPNKKTYQRAQKKGLSVETNPYCRYDTLADSDDLHKLFEVLQLFKDKNGNPPVITANTVVANPDFNAINESQFEEYQYEIFTDTLKHYYPQNEVFEIWQEGISEGIFFPQFHGREHVNVHHWLWALKNSHKKLINAFDLGFWGLPRNHYSQTIPINLQATYDAKKESEVNYHRVSLTEGLRVFKKVFGYNSKSFIPNNFIFDKNHLSELLRRSNVSILQGMKYHKQPYFNRNKHSMKRRYMGVYDGFFQVIRNVTFEPSQEKSKTGVVEKCINDIKNAYFWNKPAVVTCHRLNFIGSLDKKNREENLSLFKELLEKILKEWPDVEFLNTVQLADIAEK